MYELGPIHKKLNKKLVNRKSGSVTIFAVQLYSPQIYFYAYRWYSGKS